MPMHICKTSTHMDTIIHDEQDIALRADIEQKLQHSRVQDAHEQLLGKASNATMKWNKEAFQLPLRHNVFGLFLVPIQIHSRTYWFILDTGAQISGIRKHIVDQYHLEKQAGSLPVGSVGGTQKALPGYCLHALHIGNICFQNLPVLGLDAQDFSLRFGGIDLISFDGILGWDILSQLDFEIDDVAKQFKVLKNRYSFTYPNMIRASFPIFLMKDKNNRTLLMGFDSGSKQSWMNEPLCQTLGYRFSPAFEAMGFGVHGLEQMEIKMVKEMELYVYKAKISMKNIRTGRTNIFPNLEFSGILGNEIFRNRRIRILNSQAMILLA